MFNSLFASPSTLTGTEFIIASVVSLLMGAFIALLHSYKNQCSKNMILTLVVLPVLIQVVLMLVNGSIGAGVAVLGAFSLIRFRSQPGNSRELTSVLLATVIGVAMAKGYIGISVVVLVAVGAVVLVVATLGLGEKGPGKNLRITIPEDMDYAGLFDDLFEKYTEKNELIRVKTVNMGSLYELSYDITMKKSVNEKAFLDEIRCRNGNLNVILSKIATPKEEL